MPSHKISTEELLYYEVGNNIKKHQSLVLAFSGGLDSTVLLDILYTMYNHQKSQNNDLKQLFKLRAIHIHHGLSHYADYWASHCAEECKKRNISFDFIKVHYKKNDGTGIESTARKIRYQYLLNNLQPKETLLTAQHLNDQSETFLLALKRGSGPKGLSGMPKIRFIQNHQLLRPLLQCSKEQIYQYARNKKLKWIIDDSNIEARFDRNFLRLHILPKLKNRWPNINQNIARSAQLCAEQEKLLDELLTDELKKLHYHDNSLLLKPLINMSTEKRQALLRRWLMNFNIQMPSYKTLYHIWTNVVLSKQDAMPTIQLNKQHLLKRFQNRLYIVPKSIQMSPQNIVIHWKNVETKILLPNELGTLISKQFSNETVHALNKEKSYPKSTILSKNVFLFNNSSHITTDNITNLSFIRAPYQTEIITIKFNYKFNSTICMLGNPCRKKIKKIWQELQIPPWIRKHVPLLFYNNTLIAALGSFITQEGNIKNTDTKLGIYWTKKRIPNNMNII